MIPQLAPERNGLTRNDELGKAPSWPPCIARASTKRIRKHSIEGLLKVDEDCKAYLITAMGLRQKVYWTGHTGNPMSV